MRIRFKGLGEYSPPITQGADCLTEGREYPVLELFATADGRNMFRIEVFHDELPPLFDSRLFEVIDGQIPAHWSVSAGVRGDITVGPAGWETQGFWDAFIDGAPWAVSLYESEKNKSLG